MSSETLLFGECANLVRASTLPSLYSDSPYIALEHINQATLSLNGYAYGRDADSQKTKFSKGDILFGKLRPYFRKVVIAPFDGLCSTDIWVVRPKVGIDRNFLFYWMASEEFINRSTDTSEGTRMPQAKWEVVSKFETPKLHIDEQREIGATLRALDDRIALLRETNATLEAIAQALFKSWFVDFDPVRAKQEGREPEGMDADTAALFPDSFEESELGLVPKGWRYGTLANLAELNPESWTLKTHPETVNYIDLAGSKSNEINIITEYSFTKAPSRARRVLRFGDSIIGTVRPGNRSFAYIFQTLNNLTGSTGFAVLRPNSIQDREFVFIAATQDTSIDHLAHVADGGAYPAVRPEVVADIQTIIPNGKAIEAFHEAVEPIFAKVGENHFQAKTLASIRDTLLPRLISGQLLLPEAEAIIEEATA